MTLLVDVGNTRTKWRLIGNSLTLVDCGVILNELISQELLESVFQSITTDKIYLSSVGKNDILIFFQKYAQKNTFELHVISSRKHMQGLTFAYDESERLGVDRCLAMIGAYAGAGVLVIDAGSAITADYVSEKGEHLGGYIFPGYKMSRNALLGRTAKIGVLAELGSIELGRGTESCVNNGFALMFRAMFAELIDIAKELSISKYVLTGGDAKIFQDLSPQDVELYDNLVLDGLEHYVLCDESLEGAST